MDRQSTDIAWPSQGVGPGRRRACGRRPPSRSLLIRHDGADAGQATLPDAYANASVKRNRPSRHLESEAPAPQPPPSPLALRHLHRRQETD